MSAQPDFDEQFENLPSAMRNAKRWLVWRSIPQPGKKPKKIPFYCNGNPRSGQLDSEADYSNLTILDDALKALESGKGYAGIGFALGKDELGNYWQGIDFDDIPKWTELEGMSFDLPGYVEKSPSGNGFHAIGYGKPFPAIASSKNTDGVEAYASGRYFTVTGEGSRGDLEDLSEYVTNVLIPFTGKKRESGVSGASTGGNYSELMSEDMYRDIKEALGFIKPNDYGTWIDCGLALKRFGDRGFGLWNNWSSAYPEYSPAETQEKWAGFNPVEITYRSIFEVAEGHGWINPWKMGARGNDSIIAPNLEFNQGELPPDYFGVDDIENQNFSKTWLVDGLIELGKAYQFFGQWKSGKTLALMDCCCNLSLGREWGGRRTEKTLIVWVASESCEDVRRRLAAWKLYHKIQKSDRMAFVIRDKPIHLDEAQFALQLAAEIEHIKSLNEDIAVVTVIDTVARSMSGKSPENGEGLMSFANNLLDYVVRPLGCACIAVHHSGHGDKTRGRGSSAFPAALDGSILVEIERKGSETFVNVNAQEMRATSGGDSFQFLIETQPIKGVDNFGNQISEPVLLFVGDCVANDFDKESKIPQCGIKALIILKGMYERYKKNLGEDSDKALVSERDWRQEYYDSIGEGTKTDTKRKAFTRAVDALLERGAVVRDGVFVRLTGE